MMSNPDKKKINFHDVQKSFNDYWKDKDVSATEQENAEEGGWQQFKRWEWFMEQRTRNRMHVVALDDANAGTELIGTLRRNGVVGLLCDRDLGGGGVPVTFFGEQTTMPAGPATLALRTGAAIFPNVVYQRDGYVEGVIKPAIQFERSGKLRADIAALTQLVANELESMIAAEPTQWHVLQPVWPSDPGYQAHS